MLPFYQLVSKPSRYNPSSCASMSMSTWWDGWVSITDGEFAIVDHHPISCPLSIHGFQESSRDCSTSPPNWKDGLSWSSRGASYSEYTLLYVMHTG